MPTKRTTNQIQDPIASESLTATLSDLGQAIAKQKIETELQSHVLRWIELILQSNRPEHAAIRSQLISNVSRLVAATTLQQCLLGAIADSVLQLYLVRGEGRSLFIVEESGCSLMRSAPE